MVAGVSLFVMYKTCVCPSLKEFTKWTNAVLYTCNTVIVSFYNYQLSAEFSLPTILAPILQLEQFCCSHNTHSSVSRKFIYQNFVHLKKWSFILPEGVKMGSILHCSTSSISHVNYNPHPSPGKHSPIQHVPLSVVPTIVSSLHPIFLYQIAWGFDSWQT